MTILEDPDDECGYCHHTRDSHDAEAAGYCTGTVGDIEAECDCGGFGI